MSADAFTFAGLTIPFRSSADVQQMFDRAVDGRARLRLAICNANTLMIAKRRPDYRETLARMTLLNDGIGLDLGARMCVGAPFPENLQGSDLVPRLIAASASPLRIFLLGSRDGVAACAGDVFTSRSPQHTVVGARSGFFEPEDEEALISEINGSGADVLLVAMGNPLQEMFIMRHTDELEVPVAIGVGALFDFLSGEVARAPRWIQQIRLEFLFRLAQEPRRMARRYTVDAAVFLLAVWGEKRTKRGA